MRVLASCVPPGDVVSTEQNGSSFSSTAPPLASSTCKSHSRHRHAASDVGPSVPRFGLQVASRLRLPELRAVGPLRHVIRNT